MGMLAAEPSLLWLLAFSLIGVLLGTATGIIPGIHPNNVALILLSLLPALSHSLSAFLPATHIPMLLASLLIAASITHTFLSFIPAAFVGAPEGDTALCVLPAHHLLLEGRAYEAVKLSAAGSFLALISSFLFLMPFKFFSLAHALLRIHSCFYALHFNWNIPSAHSFGKFHRNNGAFRGDSRIFRSLHAFRHIRNAHFEL